MAFKGINWALLNAMSKHNIKHIYTRHEKGSKTMPFWANEAKEPSLIATSEKNLQKLGAKSLMEVSSRIDFTEARYFQGENQDSFCFVPQVWTEVKGANGYTPTLTPSLIHFVKKEFKGYQGVAKTPCQKSLFFTTWLSKLMVDGKTYMGFIDTSIPPAMIDLIATNEANEAMVSQLLSPYLRVDEVAEPSDALKSLAISGSSGGGYGGGYSKSSAEPEADKIKARSEAIKTVLASVSGKDDANVMDYLDNPKFVVLASLTLGLPIPSNITYTF